MGKRTTYNGAYKAKKAIGVLRGEKQLGEIAACEGLSPTMLARWCREFEDNAARVFEETGILSKLNILFVLTNLYLADKRGLLA